MSQQCGWLVSRMNTRYFEIQSWIAWLDFKLQLCCLCHSQICHYQDNRRLNARAYSITLTLTLTLNSGMLIGEALNEAVKLVSDLQSRFFIQIAILD